jgi:hypothetical protein
LALVDFLRGLVEFDPNKRWSPLQVFADDTSTFSFLGIIVFVNWNIFSILIPLNFILLGFYGNNLYLEESLDVLHQC